MVQQLNNREHKTHRYEFPFSLADDGGFRIRMAIDRENQTDPAERERVIQYRAHEAGHRDTEVTP